MERRRRTGRGEGKEERRNGRKERRKGGMEEGRLLCPFLLPFSPLREETKRKIETDGETRAIGHCLEEGREEGKEGGRVEGSLKGRRNDREVKREEGKEAMMKG